LFKTQGNKTEGIRKIEFLPSFLSYIIIDLQITSQNLFFALCGVHILLLPLLK